jgi:hypothetical protein
MEPMGFHFSGLSETEKRSVGYEAIPLVIPQRIQGDTFRADTRETKTGHVIRRHICTGDGDMVEQGKFAIGVTGEQHQISMSVANNSDRFFKGRIAHSVKVVRDRCCILMFQCQYHAGS